MIVTVPRSVYLMALDRRFSTTCLSGLGSAVDAKGRRAGRARPRPACCRSAGRPAGRLADDRGQVETRAVQLHLAGLDLREVEDIVDQGEQVLGVAVYGVQRVELALAAECRPACGSGAG